MRNQRAWLTHDQISAVQPRGASRPRVICVHRFSHRIGHSSVTRHVVNSVRETGPDSQIDSNIRSAKIVIRLAIFHFSRKNLTIGRGREVFFLNGAITIYIYICLCTCLDENICLVSFNVIWGGVTSNLRSAVKRDLSRRERRMSWLWENRDLKLHRATCESNRSIQISGEAQKFYRRHWKKFFPLPAGRRALIKPRRNIRRREIHEFSYPGLPCKFKISPSAFPVTQLNRQKCLRISRAPSAFARRQLGP